MFTVMQSFEKKHNRVMEFTITVLLVNLLLLKLAGSEGSILPLPSLLDVCDDGRVSISVCSFLAEFRNCMALRHQPASDATEDNHSYLMGKDGLTGESLQLVLLPRNIASVLLEHALNTSSGIARALGAITLHFNWKRLLIVADLSNPHFLHTAEDFYKIIQPSSLEINFVQPRDSDDEVNDIINKIDRENLRIIVLSVRPSIAQRLLCIALEKKWVWPAFAWMVHSTNLNKFPCNIEEGGFIISFHVNTLISNSTDLICTSGNHSSYSLYCDSLEEMRPLTVADISVQIGNFGAATYGLENGTITNIDIIGPTPSDLPPQLVEVGLIIMYNSCTAACFVVVTLNLILYVYYRNEPTVKATSVPLSMLIFIGCYLLLIYLVDINLTALPSHHKQSKHYRDGVCVVAALLNFLGYPLILIFSTLLVKLVRIHRIFNKFGKLNKHVCNDLALAGFAILITSPSALLLLVWVISDPYTDLPIFSFTNGLLLVAHDCVSSYEVLWLLGNLGYLCCLAVCLAIFAFLTRKIKYKKFKDTKSLTSLCFIIVFTTTLVVSYWYIARQISDVYLLFAIIQFGDYAIILECQGFIFTLKLFPVVKSCIMKRLNKDHGVPILKLPTHSSKN